MNGRYWFALVVALSGALFVASACAPAAGPEQKESPQQQTPSGSAPQQTTPQPSTQQPSKPAEAPKAKTSVSGIPLDPDAKPGGILQLAYTTEGPTFSNWEEAAGVSPTVVHPVTNMLVQNRTWGTVDDFNNKAYLELHPDLALSWEQSTDGLKWTFRLRDGVTFSDGVKFTCEDAKWTYDAIRTGEGLRRSPRAVHYLAIDNIQCVDALTMVVNLKRPKASLLYMMALPYNPIKPAHKYKGNEDEMRTKPNIGTGPYLLKEWLPGEKYVFERNPNYWDKPFPYLDGLEARQLTSAAQVAALRAGRLDIGSASGYFGGDAETIQKECTRCQFWPRAQNSLWATIVVNQQRPPWNTPDVKDAISLAIDRVKVAKVGSGGWVDPNRSGLFRAPNPYALPYERAKNIPGYNLDTPDQNKQRARELLAKAGYKPGELVVPFTVWNISETTQPFIPIQEDLEAVGFKVNPMFLETARVYDALTAGDFDLEIHGFAVAGDDPDITLYEHYYTGSDRNYGRYSNPEVDRLIDQQSQTLDQQRRRELVYNLQEMIMREHPKIILTNYTWLPVWSNRVRGLLWGESTFFSYGPARRHDHTWLAER